MIGSAFDPGVPRYRAHASLAETSLDPAGAALRAKWQATSRLARSIQARVTVQGWRQQGGALWTINQLVTLTSPKLKINAAQMLISSVTFSIDNGGGMKTELTLGPPAAWTPDPSLAAKASFGFLNLIPITNTAP